MIKRIFAALSMALAASTAFAVIDPPILKSGSLPTAELAAGVKLYNFSNVRSEPLYPVLADIYRLPDMYHINGNGRWSAGSNDFEIKYKDGVLSAGGPWVITEGLSDGEPPSLPLGSLGNLNYIEIKVTNLSANSMAVDSITLTKVIPSQTVQPDGTSAPSTSEVFGLGGISAPSNTNKVFHIGGEDLTNGFTLSGKLLLNGSSSSFTPNDVVTVSVGRIPAGDSQGPLTTLVSIQPDPVLLNGRVTVIASVSDASNGNNDITSADYNLHDGMGWRPMAVPGDISSTKSVEASFEATAPGTHTVCVRGTDSSHNTGPEACQDYVVTYRFEGFFQPVDNSTVVNSAQAGQAIPVKWRLTDANGLPIADPASFVNLLSYAVNCSEFPDQPPIEIEEVAQSAFGAVQYLGDGRWQFNWKTPTEYANTCRAMMIEFNGKTYSKETARFKFKFHNQN